MAQTGGFPQTQNNGSQVGAISNTVLLGSKISWVQTLGYSRMISYSYYTQTVPGGNFGVGAGAPADAPYAAPGLPGLLIKEMGSNATYFAGAEGRSVQFFREHRLLPEPSESVLEHRVYRGAAHHSGGAAATAIRS